MEEKLSEVLREGGRISSTSTLLYQASTKDQELSCLLLPGSLEEIHEKYCSMTEVSGPPYSSLKITEILVDKCEGLARYLRRLYRHPAIGADQVFRSFLLQDILPKQPISKEKIREKFNSTISKWKARFVR